MIRKNTLPLEAQYASTLPLVLQAEHGGGNNSTFTVRVTSSTLHLIRIPALQPGNRFVWCGPCGGANILGGQDVPSQKEVISVDNR